MTRVLGIGAIFLTALCGCAHDDAERPPAFVATEEVRFSVSEGGTPLSMPFHTLASADGTTFVGDLRPVQFSVFAGDGRFLRTLGRRGKGPGEFNALTAAGLKSDTLWVYDMLSARVTYFSDYAVARTETTPKMDSRAYPDRAAFRLADGTFVWSVLSEAHPVLVNPTRFALVHKDTAGQPRDTLATFTCRREVLLAQQGRGASVLMLRFTDCDHTAIDPSGEYLYHVSGTIARTTDTAQLQIKRWDRNGRLVWSKQIPFRPRPFTASALDTVSDKVLGSAWASPDGKVRPEFLQKVREVYAGMGSVPTVSAAVAGMDGTLFVAREPFGPTTRWTILDSAGVVLGDLALPSDARVLAANGKNLWTAETTAEGANVVVRYRLGKE
jgi:hypothetical protein